ncbi:MAG: hypothetical protein DMF31_04765 [Verrucomicrobia bacterium]|nr:MAG: hypothetical protein DMF31_04765 [Verrucomicrobiota bacterium]
MEIHRRKDQIELSELDPFLAELLRQIPTSADPGGVPAAEQRIFSSPSNGKETEICAEWKTYVEPELRRLFQTATETVATDLQQLNGNEKSFANRTLRIPSKHADAWLSALLHRKRAERPLPLAHRIAPGLEFISGKLLRFSPRIYPARTGGLRESRSGN